MALAEILLQQLRGCRVNACCPPMRCAAQSRRTTAKGTRNGMGRAGALRALCPAAQDEFLCASTLVGHRSSTAVVQPDPYRGTVRHSYIGGSGIHGLGSDGPPMICSSCTVVPDWSVSHSTLVVRGGGTAWATGLKISFSLGAVQEGIPNHWLDFLPRLPVVTVSMPRCNGHPSRRVLPSALVQPRLCRIPVVRVCWRR